MGYTNSSLVTYKNITKNKTTNRNHAIDTITIHCIVGQWTAKQGCDYFANTDRQCSANYVVGKDGSIGLSVDEKDRSWCSSSASNDNRAITIECASDTTHPYAVTDAAYNALIKLCADICKRNGIKELKWKGDKNLVGQVDKQNMTVHRWFAAKACPGDYLYNRHADIAKKVNAILGSGTKIETKTETTKTQATSFNNLSTADAVKKIGALCKADSEKSGILASISAAQFILESGWGKSELAQNANNCFGMKKSLSGNTWSGSTWDGKSVYTKETKEEYTKGTYTTVKADFRKYSSVEDSIADHSAYLNGAMNGSKKRYAGLAGEKDYKKAAQIIKDGGYATSSTYVSKLCALIEQYKLTQYDTTTSSTYPATPFTVEVIISDLNYRSEPSLNGKVNGQTGKGIFTIVEVKNGWGRLKSGAGWIYLENPEYCTIRKTTKTTINATTSTTKTVDEIAREVIQGKWGNGADRKAKLTAAGYDYNKIQKRVNELLS